MLVSLLWLRLCLRLCVFAFGVCVVLVCLLDVVGVAFCFVLVCVGWCCVVVFGVVRCIVLRCALCFGLLCCVGTFV